MKLRKHLSQLGLLKTVTRPFEQVPAPSGLGVGIPSRDCLLSVMLLAFLIDQIQGL